MCLQVQPPPDFIRVARRPKTPPVLIIRRDKHYDHSVVAPPARSDVTPLAATPTAAKPVPVDIQISPADDVPSEQSVSSSTDESSEVKGEAKQEASTDAKAVRRPMNSFMVFARYHRAVIQKAHPHKDNKAISKILGDTWGSMGAGERQRYVDMASELAEQHKKDHPDYKFRRVLKKKQKTAAPRPVVQPQYVSLQPSVNMPSITSRQQERSVRYTPYTGTPSSTGMFMPPPPFRKVIAPMDAPSTNCDRGAPVVPTMRPVDFPTSAPARFDSPPNVVPHEGLVWHQGSATPPSSQASSPTEGGAYTYRSVEHEQGEAVRRLPSNASLDASSCASLANNVTAYSFPSEPFVRAGPEPVRYMQYDAPQPPRRQSGSLWSIESMLN